MAGDVTPLRAAFRDHLDARLPADMRWSLDWGESPLGSIALVEIDQQGDRKPLQVRVLLRPGASIQHAAEDVVVAAMRTLTPPREGHGRG